MDISQSEEGTSTPTTSAVLQEKWVVNLWLII
jgi:hypothetical protein